MRNGVIVSLPRYVLRNSATSFSLTGFNSFFLRPVSISDSFKVPIFQKS